MSWSGHVVRCFLSERMCRVCWHLRQEDENCATSNLLLPVSSVFAWVHLRRAQCSGCCTRHGLHDMDSQPDASCLCPDARQSQCWRLRYVPVALAGIWSQWCVTGRACVILGERDESGALVPVCQAGVVAQPRDPQAPGLAQLPPRPSSSHHWELSFVFPPPFPSPQKPIRTFCRVF